MCLAYLTHIDQIAFYCQACTTLDKFRLLTPDVWHLKGWLFKEWYELQGEELTDRFLRILTDLAVTHCLTGESSTMTMRPGLLYFVAVDAYVRLLTMLITGTAMLPPPSALHPPQCLAVLCTVLPCCLEPSSGT